MRAEGRIAACWTSGGSRENKEKKSSYGKGGKVANFVICEMIIDNNKMSVMDRIAGSQDQNHIIICKKYIFNI